MQEHSFTLILDREPTEEEADNLYSIFDDGTISTLPLPPCATPLPQIHFDREANSLKEAVNSAIQDIIQGGFKALDYSIREAIDISPKDLPLEEKIEGSFTLKKVRCDGEKWSVEEEN